MLPSMAVVSEQEPDSTDLLIRAITTIIWLLWPKAEEAKSRSKRHLRRLNRLSLLFVPATRATDVAAITAVVGRSCVHVEVVQGSEEPLDGRLDDVKNHIKSTPWNAGMLPGPEELKTELVEDPLRFCFTRGIAAITPVAHGAALQNLLTDMYKVAPTCPLNDPSRDSLRRYIYCFCHRKIFQRLQSAILGHKGHFMGLFLPSTRRGPITRQDFERRTTRESPRYDNLNEAWLYYRLAGTHPKENFGPEPTNRQPYRLDLNEDQLWMLWEFFTSCLNELEKMLVWLDLNTRGTKADSYRKAVEVLDMVAYLMKTLYNFIYSSPTFWSLVMEMENTLDDRAGEKVTEGTRPLWPSPSSIDDPGSTFPPTHPEGGSQESASGDADNSGGLDQVGLEHESDPGSRAHPDGENSDDELEFEEVKCAIQLSGIALKVRNWLHHVTQWFGAVYDLSQGRLALAVLNKQLSVHVDVVPKAVQPQRQASLRAVVNSLGERRTANEKLELILARARELYGDWGPPENTAAFVLVKASKDDEASLEPWERLFPSSSVHCEARLASIQNVAIGVSKRCCYCCGRLLSRLGFQEDDFSDHGKVYSWAPPPGLDDEVKQYILLRLKTKLDDHLVTYAAGRRKADSSSRYNEEPCVDGTDSEVWPPLGFVLGV